MLRIAFLLVGLLLAYQLAVTLLHPVWIGPVTDWLQALITWPGLLGVILLSLWLTRSGQPGARSWWLVSGGLLAHALARTLWLVEDVFLLPHAVSLSSLDDLFFAFQYLCFLLARSCCRGSVLESGRRVWRWMPASCWVPHWPSAGTSSWPLCT